MHSSRILALAAAISLALSACAEREEAHQLEMQAFRLVVVRYRRHQRDDDGHDDAGNVQQAQPEADEAEYDGCQRRHQSLRSR